MEPSYKQCKHCGVRVHPGTTQCLVCNGREFITQAELEAAEQAVVDWIKTQKGTESLEERIAEIMVEEINFFTMPSFKDSCRKAARLILQEVEKDRKP